MCFTLGQRIERLHTNSNSQERNMIGRDKEEQTRETVFENGKDAGKYLCRRANVNPPLQRLGVWPLKKDPKPHPV